MTTQNTTEEKASARLKIAYFNRFTVEMPADAVADCSHQGQCDEDVSYWADKIARSEDVTPENLRAELKEYGAWDSDELSNDSDNWQRIVWIAAWIIKERFLIPCKTPLPPKGKTQNENIRNTK